VRRFNFPAVGLLTFDATELAVSAMPGLRIQVYTPRDEQTWERMARLRRLTP
jgi:hypothetical protein